MNKGKYKCRKCDFRFLTKEDLKMHKLNHVDKK